MATRATPATLAIAMLTACPSETPAPRSGPPPPTVDAIEPAAPERSPELIRRDGNHLVGEASPYLLQHAHNPVDWYPWGPEALDRAARERKPIFLSIGYATCHWCHVMERESFEDDEVAAFLNAHFVAIKVDREQRPDLDAVYLHAVGMLGGSTGWPLSAFLTPDREPFFGGTYWPRHASGGRPGFLDVLQQVHDTWQRDGDAVAKEGRAVLASIERAAKLRVQAPADLTPKLVDDAMAALARARDLSSGGFAGRQKFPNAPLLLATLRWVQRTGDPTAREHLVLTLQHMLAGGIRDHLAGSFHRYTVDDRWHMPHFEKTLYDNAQLAALYVEAGRWLRRDDFVHAGRAVLDDLVRAWQGDDGGFVVGFDADDPRGEGRFYAWTPAELSEVLGEADARIVATAMAVTETGERALDGGSVLHRRADEDAARTLGIDVAALHAALDRSLPALAQARARRPAPAVDDKAIVAWNGLSIMALADAGRWLDEPRYVQAAVRAATFVTEHAVDEHGRLTRGRRGDRSLGPAFLDDHALAGLGLVRLHAATGDPTWLLPARRLADEILARFRDPKTGILTRTPADATDVPVRLTDFDDGVLPSGGSAAALLLLEVGALAGDLAMVGIGRDLLARTAEAAIARPTSAGFLLVALEHATSEVREVVVAGTDDDPGTQALWTAIVPTTHARVLPARVPATGADATLTAAYPALARKVARKGTATAYVCTLGHCKAPTSDPMALQRLLSP